MMRQRPFIYLFIAVLTVTACGGGGGGGGGGGAVSVTVDTSGGLGGSAGATGGNGGFVELLKFGGTGAIEVLNSGTVDARFTLTTTTANLGTNPLSVTADTTVALNPAIPPPAGSPYLLSGDTNLYISDGTTGQPATGLSVSAGVTLTLPLNSGTAYIVLADDIDNHGTITTVDVITGLPAPLNVQCANYVGAPGSAIDTSGIQPGVQGGYIQLSANNAIYNQGTITADGPDNPTGSGGIGSTILLWAQQQLENTGNVSSRGGDSSTSNGGPGGVIDMASWHSYLYNAGAVDSSGGSGSTGGGSGGLLILSAGLYGFTQSFNQYGAGQIRNTGGLTSDGGAATTGAGGHAGPIGVSVHGGSLIHNANVSSRGGNTSDATAAGGFGGSVEVYTAPGLTSDDFEVPAGDLLFAGNINSAGGAAAASGSGNGSRGGDVTFVVDASGSYTEKAFGLLLMPTTPGNPRLALLNFASISTVGGSGNQGGNGGFVKIVDDGEIWDGSPCSPLSCIFDDDFGGDVINQVAITTRGGSVVATATTTPAAGGRSGNIELSTDHDVLAGDVVDPIGEYLTNIGAIDSSGGDSLALTTPTKNAGDITLISANDINNSGGLTANGGNDLVNDDSTVTGFGHHAGFVTISAQASGSSVINSGDINANGGNGEAQGGDGPYIPAPFQPDPGVVLFADFDVDASGASISVRGGDADVGLSGSVGGNGGWVVFNAFNATPGNVDAAGGAGDNPGNAGGIVP